MSTEADSEKPEGEPTLVVWWRHPSHVTGELVHRVGWSIPHQTRGTITIPSPHPRLDRSTVEAELTRTLTGQLHTTIHLAPASTTIALLDAATRILMAGHTITNADLASACGLDVVAGVTAELVGRGVTAHVVVEATLSAPVRDAALGWAETAIEQFAHADHHQLLDDGWQQINHTRWQQLAIQPT